MSPVHCTLIAFCFCDYWLVHAIFYDACMFRACAGALSSMSLTSVHHAACSSKSAYSAATELRKRREVVGCLLCVPRWVKVTDRRVREKTQRRANTTDSIWFLGYLCLAYQIVVGMTHRALRVLVLIVPYSSLCIKFDKTKSSCFHYNGRVVSCCG